MNPIRVRSRGTTEPVSHCTARRGLVPVAAVAVTRRTKLPGPKKVKLDGGGHGRQADPPPGPHPPAGSHSPGARPRCTAGPKLLCAFCTSRPARPRPGPGYEITRRAPAQYSDTVPLSGCRCRYIIDRRLPLRPRTGAVAAGRVLGVLARRRSGAAVSESQVRPPSLGVVHGYRGVSSLSDILRIRGFVCPRHFPFPSSCIAIVISGVVSPEFHFEI